MRICLSPGTLSLGGIGRVMLNLSEQFLARGIEVDMFLSKAEGPYLEQLPERTRVFEGGGSVKSSLVSFVNYLRRERPAAVISAHPHVNVMNLVAAKLARVPTKMIITIHIVTSVNNDSQKSFFTRATERLSRLVYHWADNIVAVSEAVANDLAPRVGIARNRIQVIHNPVVTEDLFERAEEQVNHPWLRTGEVSVVLFVGRLTDQKDLPTLLRAFAQLRRGRDVKLIMLGEGSLRVQLETLARDLKIEGDVDLPGYAANPFAYMRRAAVVVLSSAWEGLPTVLIEALALGTPVVSTDCPGGSREILDGGRFGPLVRVGDAAGLAIAIEEVLRDPPDRYLLQKRGDDFSVQRATDNYLRLVGSSDVKG